MARVVVVNQVVEARGEVGTKVPIQGAQVDRVSGSQSRATPLISGRSKKAETC